MSEHVTIVIPHFRAPVLLDCLESLYKHSDWPIRVVVVDDGGNAPSIQQAAMRFPQIEILRNERNMGFSGSCNRGLNATQSRYAVLLNDDTRVTPGWLQPMVERADSDPQIAACQPKLLSALDDQVFDYGGGAGGYIDALGYTFCRGRLLDEREQDCGQYDREVPLFWACGSALFLRVEAARQLDFLDLDYYMHFEEIDLCWRLQLAGHRIWSVPRSVVYHHSGFSLPPASFRKTYLNHRNNLVMHCKNQSLNTLLWLLPLRVPLEILASLGYLTQRRWSSTLAPWASLLWLITHPLNIFRRRRHSRMHRKNAARDGIYSGSVLFQHYVRGINHASDLMTEENLL